MTAALVRPWHVDAGLFWQILWVVMPLAVVQLVQGLTKRLDFLEFRWVTLEFRAASYAALLYLVVFRGVRPEPFVYFQF